MGILKSRYIYASFVNGETRIKSISPAYQWERGLILRISGIDPQYIYEAHFTHDLDKTSAMTITVSSGDYVEAVIPDIILQKPWEVFAHIAYRQEETDHIVQLEIRIPVIRRSKPANYEADLTEGQKATIAGLEANFNQSIAKIEEIKSSFAEIEAENMKAQELQSGEFDLTIADLTENEDGGYQSERFAVYSHALRIKQTDTIATTVYQTDKETDEDIFLATIYGNGYIPVTYGETYSIKVSKADGDEATAEDLQDYSCSFVICRKKETHPIPEMYGAFADGITDDSSAFQYALENSSVIYLTTSAYGISQIVVPSGCAIIGSGKTSRLMYVGSNGLVDGNGVTRPDGNVSTAVHETMIVVPTTSRNVTLRDFMIHGGKQQARAIHDGVTPDFDSADTENAGTTEYIGLRTLIDGLRIYSCYEGIRLSSMGAIVSNCELLGGTINSEAGLSGGAGIYCHKSDHFIDNTRIALFSTGVYFVGGTCQASNTKACVCGIGFHVVTKGTAMSSCIAQDCYKYGLFISGDINCIQGSFCDNGCHDYTSTEELEMIRADASNYVYSNIFIDGGSNNNIICICRYNRSFVPRVSCVKDVIKLKNAKNNTIIANAMKNGTTPYQTNMLNMDGSNTDNYILINGSNPQKDDQGTTVVFTDDENGNLAFNPVVLTDDENGNIVFTDTVVTDDGEGNVTLSFAKG